MPIDFSNAWKTGVHIINDAISLLPNLILAFLIFVLFLILAAGGGYNLRRGGGGRRGASGSRLLFWAGGGKNHLSPRVLGVVLVGAASVHAGGVVLSVVA